MEQSQSQKYFLEASELLQKIVAALVEHPEQMKILFHLHPPRVQFTIVPAPADVALVLGRSGHMMRALREIFQQLGKKHNLSYSVDILVGAGDAERKCIHCGCTQARACMTPGGPCGWRKIGKRNVCSNRECVTKEVLWEGRN